MRRILAVAVLALAAAVGLPAASQAGGPTSVLITQPGQSAGALYYDDAAYDALLGLLPADATRGKPLAPGGAGADYTLTWMVHDVMPWRFDRVHLAPDGTAWVMTTFTAEDTGGWAQVDQPDELAALLTQVLDDSAAPEVVSIPADTTAVAAPAPAPAEPDPARLSLTGWRWVVPGVLLGLVVGAVAARRHRDDEPRQVLISSEA
jgi:hypothetical protein